MFANVVFIIDVDRGGVVLIIDLYQALNDFVVSLDIFFTDMDAWKLGLSGKIRPLPMVEELQAKRKAEEKMAAPAKRARGLSRS